MVNIRIDLYNIQIALYLSSYYSFYTFRTTWGVQFVPCAVPMAGLLFLLESPRWLASKVHVEEAMAMSRSHRVHRCLSTLVICSLGANDQGCQWLCEYSPIVRRMDLCQLIGGA